MKESRAQKIINFSLFSYMSEVDNITKEEFCFSCPDKKYNCFPCPMSRNVGQQILPTVIYKHSMLN